MKFALLVRHYEEVPPHIFYMVMIVCVLWNFQNILLAFAAIILASPTNNQNDIVFPHFINPDGYRKADIGNDREKQILGKTKRFLRGYVN